MFKLDTFVADCVSAVATEAGLQRVCELMRQAFADPSAVTMAIGEPQCGGLFPIYRSKTLTIVNVVWKPGMTIAPHEHRIGSVIGIYSGREDNIFWRRIENDPAARIEAVGAQALSTGDVVALDAEIIHSVLNPISRLTGAIHIYGGDFFEIERSEWDAETLTEHALDMSKIRALFGG